LEVELKVDNEVGGKETRRGTVLIFIFGRGAEKGGLLGATTTEKDWDVTYGLGSQERV
jgi:hypothetical protein